MKIIKQAIFIVGVIVLCLISYGKALDFYFWKDDWAWLWSSNYNPADFFGTTVGTSWFVRTGLFMYPYVIYLYKYIQNSYIWQSFGLILKIVNSVALYFLIYSVTKKKYIAVIGSLVYASYSGGIESYTWHKLNALATFFVISGFTFYSRFLEKIDKKYFIYAYLFFLLAFFSYVGRSAGIVLVVIFWNTLLLLKKNLKVKYKRFLVLSSLLYIIPYLLFSRYVLSVDASPQGYTKLVVGNINLFFGIIGNLLKNPLFKQNEMGGLSVLDKLSYFLGFGVFLCGIAFGISYLIKRTIYLLLLTVFTFWIYFFYITNWIFGGGGIFTLLGSGHRYLSVSGVGVIILYSLLIISLNKKVAIILTILSIILNLNYSKYLIGIENSLRSRELIIPIHKTILDKVPVGKIPRLLVIDTPNKLKSFVVLGWFPYTFSYYRGITDIQDFPTVFPTTESAYNWVCAKSNEERTQIQNTVGVIDYQNSKSFSRDDVYAWYLRENGQIDDKTENFRSNISNCLTSTKNK